MIGAGKAAAAMARAVEAHWLGGIEGLVVTRYGHGAPCQRIEAIEAAHPVPDEAGQKAAASMLAVVGGLTSDDLVLALVSGGGSALLALPFDGITLAEKQQMNRALLKSGASIAEMNCVRKHVSAIKDPRKWAAYRSQVPATLEPWRAELVFRGKAFAVLGGSHAHTDTVGDPLPRPRRLPGMVRLARLPGADPAGRTGGRGHPGRLRGVSRKIQCHRNRGWHRSPQDGRKFDPSPAA